MTAKVQREPYRGEKSRAGIGWEQNARQAVGRNRRLFARWGMLQAVRSVLSGLALLLFLLSAILAKAALIPVGRGPSGGQVHLVTQKGWPAKYKDVAR